MANKSDHDKPFTDINKYIPEVYRSSVGTSVFDVAFNRHLTKDDTTRMTGFIGEGNPIAIVDRRIVESTPHRQAYQLAPTVVSEVGTNQYALSFKAFQQQLSLMGVNIDRLPTWGSTLQFNWVPPINIDMLINYQNYFWRPAEDPSALPQYLIIENRINKAQGRVESYVNMLAQRGESFALSGVNFVESSLLIEGQYTDLFTAGFILYTKDSFYSGGVPNPNLQDKFWQVRAASYDSSTNKTSIEVEGLTSHLPLIPLYEGTNPNDGSFEGDWYYDTTTNHLYSWSVVGNEWVIKNSAITATLSLTEYLHVLQTSVNCVNNQDLGWDIALWDDNDTLTWNSALLTAISSSTPPLAPTVGDLWYDTSTDELKQFAPSSVWVTTTTYFSAVIANTTGTARWDCNTACASQTPTEWASQNQWVHKSQLSSTSGATRAQLPILEYGSTVELNEWSRTIYSWKYRSDTSNNFVTTTQQPSRLELEPIKGYFAEHNGSQWVLYLFHTLSTMNRDADYSDVFKPGYRFRITNDNNISHVYTTDTVEYREITIADSAIVQGNIGTNVMCTIVTIVESTFSSVQIAGDGADFLHTRIEPTQTSSGHTWRGYHVHWVMDDQATTVVPTSHQRWNMYLTRSYDTTTSITPGSIPEFPSTFASGVVGVAHQEYTTGTTAITHVPLHPLLQYDAAEPHMYATPGSNEIRVYVNNVRQYGTYGETFTEGLPNYTVIGQTAYDSTFAKIPYVTGITFDNPLDAFDIVRIEVGAAPFNCMGKMAVPVRTVEDEVEFALAVNAGTQPAYRSITQCYHLNQVKTSTNQYPLFNVYDVTTSAVVDANPIFSFDESADEPINPYILRRIVADGSKEYVFKQHLIDRDDNVITAYKHVQDMADYWYSPLLRDVFHWDGYAWTNRVLVTTTINSTPVTAVRRPIVSTSQPSTTLDMSLWFNTVTDTLLQYVNGSWTPVTDTVVINGSDPLLRTVWRHGSNVEDLYVPSYVDVDQQPVTIGSLAGDWEVVDQWMYNSEHANKQFVKYSQLLTHLRTIIEQQPPIPGVQGGGIHTLTQEEYNYGLGGTIKEHNDSFDTLISAVNVNNVTPLGIIDFASLEYESCILRIRDIFNTNVTNYLCSYEPETLVDLGGYVSNNVITTYELNDFTSTLYGDSSSYIRDTDTGIKNWISTIPIFNLGPKYRPHTARDGNNVHLLHHDGHRSTLTYTTVEQDRIARAVCNTPDARVINGTLGKISLLNYPTTESLFTTAFGGSEVRRGVYWFRTGSIRKLYRFEAYDVTIIDPSFYDAQGVELPNGVMYYNTVTNTTYRKDGLSWVVASATPGDITPLWKEINLASLLGDVLLDIEQRLYDVCPDYDPVFNYSSLTPNEDEQSVYDTLMKSRYDNYVSIRNIPAPAVNDDYVITDAFTWNYAYSQFNVDDKPRIINGVETLVSEDYNVSAWQELYTRVYGTPYPHLEPWKLQGYYDKPTWWDDEYLNTDPTLYNGRRWKSVYDATNTPSQPGTTLNPDNDPDTSAGMWENIRIGVVPAGRSYPDGDVSTGNPVSDGKTTVMPMYRYFSVNISNVPVAGYAPDALFPPYFASPSADPQIRSLFTTSAQITNASADYAFGDVGPTEWAWLTSTQHVYDQPAVAFTMQPVKFLHAAFGPTYTLIDGLQVDVLFKQVYSHEDALFHGDAYNTNKQYLVNGLNQWYVNYNRYTGFDTNTEFRSLWVGWNPKLTYQFGGIVDTSSFEIANKYFDITDKDWDIVLVNNGVIRDVWVDAFEVSLLNIPPAVIQYNNQNLWKMELDSLAALSRNITYYGVRHYPSTIDVNTNTFTANSFNIVKVTPAFNRFYIAGDQTLTIVRGTSINVTGDNQGLYTVTSVIYDMSTNQTRLTVAEPVLYASTVGTITLALTLPWTTGDIVVMSSSKFLPAPIKPNTAYYIIRTSTSTYKLAETFADAHANNAIDITTSGDGVFHVSELESSFNVFGGAGNTLDTWFHYVVDKTDIRTFVPPMTISGMQTLVNIIDGYASRLLDTGIVNNNAEAGDFDAVTGRLVDWQLETERFIDWAYGLRQSRIRVSDRYDVSVNTVTNEFTFMGMTPHWMGGTAVTLTSTGSIPDPMIAGAVYYVVSTGVPGVIKLSTSANTLDASAHVDLVSAGSGQVAIGLYDAQRAYPRFEINPYRNNVWVDTPKGVLANVIEGPYSDIRVQQTIFDQYSRPVGPTQLVVYRQDKQSRIAIRPEIPNDVDAIYKDDPYNYIHIGGGHFFIEGYEHFLIFNDYTTGGDLIYDPFVGLHTSRFNVDYLEKADYTLRPTLGGYYLTDNHFERNIEGAISDMQMYYDVLGLSETLEVAHRARELVGFRGRTSFLDALNVNTKTQFLFYRGMIQAKGSVNSIQAYINSRRFVDAKHDEFWAWKIAEYGDTHPRIYPELKLFALDGAVDDIRFQFLALSETETDADVVQSLDKGFLPITVASADRWVDYPEQRHELDNNPLFFDASVTDKATIFVSPFPPAVPVYPSLTQTDIDYWFNSTYNADADEPGDPTSPVYGYKADVNKMYAYNGWDRTWNYEELDPIKVIWSDGDLNVYVKLKNSADDVRIVVKQFDETTTTTVHDYDLTTLPSTSFVKINANLIRMNYNLFVNANGTTHVPVIITVYSINQSTAKTSPAKLIDTKSNSVLQDIPMWHPARNQHSPSARHNIDFMNARDPARYGYTITDESIWRGWSKNFWNQMEEGKVWMDTSYLGYLPYHDDKIYPDVNDRLYKWGKLAPWGDTKVYQWTKSTVHPSQWTGSGTAKSTVFVRQRLPSRELSIDPSTSTVSIVGGYYTNGEELLFVQEEGITLPTGIEGSYVYTAHNVTGQYVPELKQNVYTFQLIDPSSEEVVSFTDVGAGQQKLIKAFTDGNWTDFLHVYSRISYADLAAPISYGVTNVDVPLVLPNNELIWTPDTDTWVEWFPNYFLVDHIVGYADVYKNGVLVEANRPLSGLTYEEQLASNAYGSTTLKVTLANPLTVDEHDIIDVVRSAHVFTPEELAFDPNREDTGTNLIQWKTDYNFSTNEILTNPGDVNSSQATKYYYFWVEGSTARDTTKSNSLSTFDVATQIRDIPTPYMILQRPKEDAAYEFAYPQGSSVYDAYQLPVKYREVVVRGVAPYVRDDNRYIIRFTRDLALRDTHSTGNWVHKNKHEEWMVIREAQMNTIPRELWDRLTEAVVGYKLDDPTARVPALERELYDATYGADTQYGLGEGQAFVNKDLGLATIIHYLKDATNDFTPIDIDYFFSSQDFTTPEGIQGAMNAIYTTFNSQHVNAIWFDVLNDSLTLRAKYKELFKTSWIALHGIRVLDVGGMFDD